MEDIAKVSFIFQYLVGIILFLFSYRVKPDPYGTKGLFGIDLAPTNDKTSVAGIIRVGDSIQVTKDEPDFWGKK